MDLVFGLEECELVMTVIENEEFQMLHFVCDFVLFEGLTLVTLQAWIVCESELEVRIQTEGDVSKEVSRIVVQFKLFVFTVFRSTSFHLV